MVVGLIDVGAYLIVARYFANVTDLALKHKMAHEFHALAAPLPTELIPADRDWSLVRADLGLRPAPRPVDDEEDEDEAYALLRSADSAELAAIIVLPLDAVGRVLFYPSPDAPPLTPDLDALRVALSAGSDLRTVVTPDGYRARLLTYRLTRPDGPAALQLARELGDQERVLEQLTGGLLVLAMLSMTLVGIVSWWLAGRALHPAQEAWDRQQRFIASASHELRTPLTLIRASAEVALRSLPVEQHDQRELLGDLLAESDHMRRLVDDLLVLSRLDSGRLTLLPTRVELATLFAEIERQVARLGAEQQITISAHATGSVRADPDRLRQILLILFDNALRHTPAGGRIQLTAEPEGRMVRLTLQDSGRGIEPEHLPHIFERFYRADPARSREHGNAGLGLSIAKGLVEAMGGQIGVTSRPQQGSSFWLTLPLMGGAEGVTLPKKA
jgi:signal transduction histidine kinase